jgi:hypothetical protein
MEISESEQMLAVHKINDALAKIPFYWADEKKVFNKNQTCIYPHYLRLEYPYPKNLFLRFCKLSENIYIVHFENDIAYVGRTTLNIQDRLHQHKQNQSPLGKFFCRLEENYRWRDVFITTIECFNISNTSLEALLINELNPMVNKRYETLEKELAEIFYKKEKLGTN